MSKTQIAPVIEAAVEWWAQYLTRPAIGDEANGMEGFGSMLATLAKKSAQKPISKEQITLFKDFLNKEITKKVRNYTEQDITISTDWYPEMELADACVHAKISGTEFPSKTMMWIYPHKGSVKVQIGTRQEPIVVYPKQPA
jgi:hypothetical protein